MNLLDSIPMWVEFVSSGEQEQDREVFVSNQADQFLDEAEGRRIAPMQVVDHDGCRLLSGNPNDPFAEPIEGLAAEFFSPDRDGFVFSREFDSEEAREERDRLVDREGGAAQRIFELFELNGGRIAPPEPDDLFEEGGDRAEGRASVLRDAMAFDPAVACLVEPFSQ